MTAASLTGLLAFALFVVATFVLWGQALGVLAAVTGLVLVCTTRALVVHATRCPPDALLPPRALAGRPAGAEPAARERLQLAGRADRQQRPGDRVAAIVERDQRARLVAACAQLLDHVDAGERPRALRVAVVGLPGTDRGHRRAAAGTRAVALGAGDRAVTPALHQLAELERDLLA